MILVTLRTVINYGVDKRILPSTFYDFFIFFEMIFTKTFYQPGREVLILNKLVG